MQLFLEFTSFVILATLVSLILRTFKQPLIVGYILTGILLGPNFTNVTHTASYLDLFSKIGITILLFIIGLNLRPSVIKEVGKVSIIGGIAQIVITALLGFALAFLLGVSFIASLYIGLALSFSSTIIILKLLSDKDDLPKVYGKVTIGILLVQDLVAIVALLFISSFAGTQQVSLAHMIITLLLKLLIAGVSVYLVTRFIIFHAIHYIAQSQELLFLFSIAWGLGLASIFYLGGSSVEVGALVAGVSLSITPFADSIASRLKPLRDFFIVLFFILLGSNLILSNVTSLIVPVILLSLFVLILKPLIVFLLMNVLGYKNKQGFQTGVSLAQVSEFSFILAALGLSIGHLDKAAVTLITITGLVTITGSSYFILYSDELFPYFERLLKKLEIVRHINKMQATEEAPEVILFGFDRVGHDFIEAFKKLGKSYVVVDYNPEMITQLEDTKVPFKYGDVEDIEFLRELRLAEIKLCVSTIPDMKVNSLLIKNIKEVNKHAIIIVRARERFEAKELYDLGATYVVMPHYLGAKYATSMIKRIGLDVKGFAEERDRHLEYVNK